LRDGATRRLRTSDASRTIVIEDSRSDGARREQAARFMALAVRANRWDLRSLGSTVSLPYVAGGRIAAYVLFWSSAVHCSAGSLLVAEAGGSLSDLHGRPWTIHSDSMMASATADLHEQLIDLACAAR
jgi:myo-inositol-1(or 4)-monophosphatase